MSPDPNRTAAHSQRGTFSPEAESLLAQLSHADSTPEVAPGAGTVVQTPDEQDQAASASAIPVRAVVAGYEVVGELGRGGMGVVFKARHAKLNRTVALKMILAGRADAKELIRFLAEAEAVAAVKHTNVVQVHEYGEVEGRPFMALEYLPGGTLEKVLSSKRHEPAVVAELMGRITRGVAAAHALGIVHRDLKPANVLLDESGEPKVTDFGLAKRGIGSDLTGTQAVMGTPSYMSPEQAKGDTKFVGPQADVWALGVILYEALTGERPFRANGVQEILSRILTADPVPPRKHNAAIPRDLELICLKCLEKQPHERYATAKELADDLDRYARNEPISVRPAGPIERAAKLVKRNKVVSGAAAAVFLALTVGTGVSIGFGLEAKKQAKAAGDAADETTRKGNELAKVNGSLVLTIDQMNVALAKALFGPVAQHPGIPSMSPYEISAFRELASRRGTPVPALFLQEALRTELTAQQLSARTEAALHAAIGLDLKFRDQFEQEFLARVAAPGVTPAQQVTLVLAYSRWSPSPHGAKQVLGVLRDSLTNKTNPYAFVELVEGVLALASLLERDEAAAILGVVARTLIDAMAQAVVNMQKFGNATVLSPLATALLNVAARMAPDEAERVLTDAAAVKTGDAAFHVTLADGVVAVAARLEPDKAAEFLTRMMGTIGESELFARKKLATGLAAAAGRMEPNRGAKLITDAMGKADPDAFSQLVQGLPAVAARMEPERAYNMLLDALNKNPLPPARAKLALAWSAAAARMEPAKAVAAHHMAIVILFEGMASTSDNDPDVLRELAMGLREVISRIEPDVATTVLLNAMAGLQHPAPLVRAVAGLPVATAWMEPDKAVTVWGAVAKRLADEMVKTTDPSLLRSLALRLSVGVAKMEPAAAAGTRDKATRLLRDAIAKNTDPLVLELLAEGLSAVAEPDEAAAVCTAVAERLGSEMVKTAEPFRRSAFATALSRMATRMKPDRAAVLCGAAAKLLTELMHKDTFPITTNLDHILASALCAVAMRIEPDKAVKLLLDEIAKTKDEDVLLTLTLGLAAWMEPDGAAEVLLDAVARTPAIGRKELSDRLSAATLGLPCANRAAGSLGSPYRLLSAIPLFPLRPKPLPQQQLVEFLKHPFCVGEARRAVLDALEVTYNRKFADQWEFVQYVRDNKLDLDLLTPPKRSQFGT